MIDPETGRVDSYVECTSCKALILWCVSTKGNRMPLDARPTEAGNVIIEGTGRDQAGRELPRAVVLGKGDRPLGDPLRHTSHFATCPDAAMHRAPRNGRTMR